jgi:nitrogen fixation NifU-like protein
MRKSFSTTTGGREIRAIQSPSHRAEGYNPLCGDRLSLYVQVDGNVITDVAFESSGCAISKASASLMTDAVKGHRGRGARCSSVFITS